MVSRWRTGDGWDNSWGQEVKPAHWGGKSLDCVLADPWWPMESLDEKVRTEVEVFMGKMAEFVTMRKLLHTFGEGLLRHELIVVAVAQAEVTTDGTEWDRFWERTKADRYVRRHWLEVHHEDVLEELGWIVMRPLEDCDQDDAFDYFRGELLDIMDNIKAILVVMRDHRSWPRPLDVMLAYDESM